MSQFHCTQCGFEHSGITCQMLEECCINAAHPFETNRYDLYDRAQRLVTERHAKGDLVELVNWLLWRIENTTQVAPRDLALRVAAVSALKDNSELLDRLNARDHCDTCRKLIIACAC